jgi:hypothetical protein
MDQTRSSTTTYHNPGTPIRSCEDGECTTTYVGGGISSSTSYWPSYTNVVEIMKSQPPEEHLIVYDAMFVRQLLRDRHGLER